MIAVTDHAWERFRQRVGEAGPGLLERFHAAKQPAKSVRRRVLNWFNRNRPYKRLSGCGEAAAIYQHDDVFFLCDPREEMTRRPGIVVVSVTTAALVDRDNPPRHAVDADDEDEDEEAWVGRRGRPRRA